MDTWTRPAQRGCAWILDTETGSIRQISAIGETKTDAEETAMRNARKERDFANLGLLRPARFVALTSAAANAAGIVAAFYAPLEKTAG
mgnify:CR=1 FL=1